MSITVTGRQFQNSWNKHRPRESSSPDIGSSIHIGGSGKEDYGPCPSGSKILHASSASLDWMRRRRSWKSMKPS